MRSYPDGPDPSSGMPAILLARDYDRWLDREETKRLPLDLLQPFEAEEMKMLKFAEQAAVDCPFEPSLRVRLLQRRHTSREDAVLWGSGFFSFTYSLQAESS